MATDAKTGQPIFGRYHTGLRNVGSYQVSGWPYITGSVVADDTEVKIPFPTVTKSVTVIASGSFSSSEMYVYFAPIAGTANIFTKGHKVALKSEGDSVTLNVKCSSIYLTGLGANAGATVIAELTNIPTASMPTLTGPGIDSDGTQIS